MSPLCRNGNKQLLPKDRSFIVRQRQQHTCGLHRQIPGQKACFINVNLNHYNRRGLTGPIQKASFLSLRRDLEQFLISYDKLLSDNQRSEITKPLPLLQAGAEMHDKIYNLFRAQPSTNSTSPSTIDNEMIESLSADPMVAND